MLHGPFLGSSLRRTVLVAFLLAASVCVPAAAQSPVADARAYRVAHEAQILRDYAEFLRLPNVSSDSAAIRANAEYIQQAFAKRGIETERLTADGAPPVVTGTIRTPGATRTLGIYVHYDGQPVDEDQWTHGPWTPTLYTGSMLDGGTPRPFPEPGEQVDPEARLYARSASDDKAPLAALLAVLDAFEEHGHALTSNVVFYLDGEEEVGSPHLKTYLETHRDRFDDVDLWLFCDGPVHQSRRPQIVYGVRGVTGLQLTVYGARRSLHSGHYGNWAPVPGTRLANLLASMKAADGTIRIDGFYDTVVPIGPEERAALDRLPPVDSLLRADLALARTEGADTATIEERLLLPSLTVRGLSSGNVGDKTRNVIPSAATAALGVRLVEGNTPDGMLDRLEAHIRQQGYHITRSSPTDAERREHAKLARVTRGAGYPAFRTRMDHPLAQQVVAAAERAAGDAVLRVPTLGGTLPLFPFDEVLKAPGLIVPMANHDNNQHAPNENLRLANLWYGIDLYAALLTLPDG